MWDTPVQGPGMPTDVHIVDHRMLTEVPTFFNDRMAGRDDHHAQRCLTIGYNRG